MVEGSGSGSGSGSCSGAMTLGGTYWYKHAPFILKTRVQIHQVFYHRLLKGSE